MNDFRRRRKMAVKEKYLIYIYFFNNLQILLEMCLHILSIPNIKNIFKCFSGHVVDPPPL